MTPVAQMMPAVMPMDASSFLAPTAPAIAIAAETPHTAWRWQAGR